MKYGNIGSTFELYELGKKSDVYNEVQNTESWSLENYIIDLHEWIRKAFKIGCF